MTLMFPVDGFGYFSDISFESGPRLGLFFGFCRRKEKRKKEMEMEMEIFPFGWSC